MSNIMIYPTTLEGVKRLAKSIKRTLKITHTQALDEAARQAEFENFRHAQQKISVMSKPGPISTHMHYITAYWRDTESNASGRETLQIMLPTQRENIISKARMKYERYLRNFRADAHDHLERIHDVQSQKIAREEVCAVARALQFMTATQLQPVLPKEHPRSSLQKLPGGDHQAIWIDQITGSVVWTDEPYDLAIKGKEAERATWAKNNGYQLIEVQWPGMYVPDASILFLLTQEKGFSLERVVNMLDALQLPVKASEWDGESASYAPTFVSPGRKSVGIQKRDRTQNTLKNARAYKGSIGYSGFLIGAQRRPNDRMPINVHEKVGRLLHSALVVCRQRLSVYNPVDRIRSELDEWVQREYNHDELPSEQFFQLYYPNYDHGHNTTGKMSASGIDEMIRNLTQVMKLITQHYPDSAPRRNLERSLATAERALLRWRSKHLN